MRATIQTMNILLIEDDEEDFILLKKHLSRIHSERYEVIWEPLYENGLLRMLDTKHDLCMLDYRLGEHNGIELIEEARKRGYILPIVLLTGASGQEIDIQALQAGADDYIDKGQLQGELLHRVIRYAIERKRIEHERERMLRVELERQELEQKRNEFISMVVHELKTPLTSLRGYVQLLARRCSKAGDEQMYQLTQRMDSQIGKLNALINDFQDVTRFVSGRLQLRESHFVFDELVDEIIDEVQLTTQQQTIYREGKTSTIVWGDAMRIGQVITNFLTNAIKYASMADSIIVKTMADEHKVTLCVQDFGPGIVPELQARVFDPFYRLDEATQKDIPGLGLGLHIASEIVKRHGGEIWVESEEGEGAKFCFSLSLDRSESTSRTEDTRPA